MILPRMIKEDLSFPRRRESSKTNLPTWIPAYARMTGYLINTPTLQPILYKQGKPL